MFEKNGYRYRQCRFCGLVSTYPIPEPKLIEEHYCRKFEEGNYALLRLWSHRYLSIYRNYFQLLAKRLQSYGLPFEGLKVLDVGCFTGDFLELLRKRGADVYGLELQDEAVKIANQKLPGRVFKADVFSKDFPQLQFDIVSVLGVIEHVVDPIGLLVRLSGLIRPRGTLLLQTPDSGSALARLMGKHWPPYAPVEHINLFSKKSLRLLLQRLRYEDIAFKAHWKTLPFAYIYNMSKNFGPEFHDLLTPFYRLLPSLSDSVSLPVYVGETILTALKV
jgi:SAM-dependent methyltransferase